MRYWEEVAYKIEAELTLENKIDEYDKRLDIIIRHMIKMNDYRPKVINARELLQEKRREKIEEYTKLFLDTYPYESETPIICSRDIVNRY